MEITKWLEICSLYQMMVAGEESEDTPESYLKDDEDWILKNAFSNRIVDNWNSLS